VFSLFSLFLLLCVPLRPPVTLTAATADRRPAGARRSFLQKERDRLPRATPRPLHFYCFHCFHCSWRHPRLPPARALAGCRLDQRGRFPCPRPRPAYPPPALSPAAT